MLRRRTLPTIPLLRPFLRLLGVNGYAAWRTRSHPVRGRRRALREEIGYWEQWLSTRGGKYADEFEYRFDASVEIADPALRIALASLERDEVSVLDVGAGPASTVGCCYPGKTVNLSAVDPLADSYNRLLDRAGLVPPVRTERLEGERLVERFGRDRFDVAYSRNALDHAVDPSAIVRGMLEVVRPGGYVVLRHVRNEGVRQKWVQLHQWNFEERDGRLVVWRPGGETDLSGQLAARAEVTCYREPSDEADMEWVVGMIRKL